MGSLAEIKKEAKTLAPELVTIRRHLHQYPELSFREEETARFIAGTLKNWGIEHQTGIGGHGITGILKGKHPDKKTIALRADMDALAIQEQTSHEFQSAHPGVMHACGHDVHMSCLLGALKILNKQKNNFEGSIKFIFQPAEEELPGGALQMIEEGVLQNPEPTAIFAQHVFPELEVGQVGVKSGMYMASSDEVKIWVRGKGGHAAIPEKRDDTVLAAAELLLNLEKILNEKKPKEIPSILALGRFIANGTFNVIPSEVELLGTFRTFSEEWRTEAHDLIHQITDEVTKSYGVKGEVAIRKGYPFLVNDDQLTQLFRDAAAEYVGKENVKDLDIRMTVEDFARFGQLIPACFYRLGTGNASRYISSNLHTPTFDVDESSIELGTGLMAWLAIKSLKTN